LINQYRNFLSHGISEKDSGIYNAMNKGINLATGNYCLFLNSGDVLVDEHVLENVFAHTHEASILYGNMMIDFMNGTRQLGKMPAVLTRKHMLRDTVWHPVSFIKRSLFGSIGIYDENFSIAADYDFFLRAVVVKKVSTYFLNQTIAEFRLDGMSSLPGNRQRLLAERRKIQRRYFSDTEIDAALKVTMGEKWIRKMQI